jgi:DNA-binding CsgD family transcriptional regulator
MGAITDISRIVKQEKSIRQKLSLIYNEGREILKYDMEKLRNELDIKQKELAIQLELFKHAKSEMEGIFEEISTLKPFLNDEGRNKLPNIARRYKQLNDDSWMNLQNKFHEINYAFFEALEKICPGITKTEKTLCAYLKMNLTSSEISKITHRSLNSINVALIRLRAKLKVNNNKDLKTYISGLKTEFPSYYNSSN